MTSRGSNERVVTPGLVIGLGTTGCLAVKRLENTISEWSNVDRARIDTLYLDTREEVVLRLRKVPL